MATDLESRNPRYAWLVIDWIRIFSSDKMVAAKPFWFSQVTIFYNSLVFMILGFKCYISWQRSPFILMKVLQVCLCSKIQTTPYNQTFTRARFPISYLLKLPLCEYVNVYYNPPPFFILQVHVWSSNKNS